MLRAVAPLLIQKGYVIKVFDLIDTDRSDSFNPFPYIRDDKDAMKLVNNLIRNTTPKSASNSDPFWESATRSLAVKVSGQTTNTVVWITGNSTGGMTG